MLRNSVRLFLLFLHPRHSRNNHIVLADRKSIRPIRAMRRRRRTTIGLRRVCSIVAANRLTRGEVRQSGMVAVNCCARTLAHGNRQNRDCQVVLGSVSPESYATTEYLLVLLPFYRGVGGARGRLLTLPRWVQRTRQDNAVATRQRLPSTS
jgi:hypothetical protein